ncbi:MAG: hypothetical protein JJ863_05525 [Deltaproteobacteria bacterium]|nr:hypothetical protein [Deltaproteobacteria bacterium]
MPAAHRRERHMELDQRLKTLATGQSVADAIASYIHAQGADTPDPIDEAREESEAIVEIMFLMAAVDGHISDAEIQQLRASIQAIEDMGAIDGVAVEPMLESFTRGLDTEGWSQRLNDAAARVRAPDARSFAFRLAAGVAFVDDFVAHAEAAAIDSLAAAFEIPKDEAQAILRDVHDTLFGGPANDT